MEKLESECGFTDVQELLVLADEEIAEAMKLSNMNLGEKSRFRLAVTNLKQPKAMLASSASVPELQSISNSQSQQSLLSYSASTGSSTSSISQSNSQSLQSSQSEPSSSSSANITLTSMNLPQQQTIKVPFKSVARLSSSEIFEGTEYTITSVNGDEWLVLVDKAANHSIWASSLLFSTKAVTPLSNKLIDVGLTASSHALNLMTKAASVAAESGVDPTGGASAAVLSLANGLIKQLEQFRTNKKEAHKLWQNLKAFQPIHKKLVSTINSLAAPDREVIIQAFLQLKEVLTSAVSLVEKVNKQGMSRTLMNFAQAASIAQKFQDIDKDFQLILQKVQFAISLIHYDKGTGNSNELNSQSSSGWKVGDELSSDFHEHKKKNKGNCWVCSNKCAFEACVECAIMTANSAYDNIMKRVYDNDIRDDEQLLSQVAIFVENKAYDDAINCSTNCFNTYNNYSYPGLLLYYRARAFMGLNKKANALQDLEIAVNSHRFCFYSDFSLDREFKGVFTLGSSHKDPAFSKLLQKCKDNFNELYWYSEVLTEKEVEYYTNIFLKYDTDDSGKLDRYELSELLEHETMTSLKLAKILELFPIPNSKEGFELEQFLGVIASLKKNGNLNDPNKRERKIRSSKKKSSSTKKLSKDKGKERNRDKDRLEKEKIEMEREKLDLERQRLKLEKEKVENERLGSITERERYEKERYEKEIEELKLQRERAAAQRELELKNAMKKMPYNYVEKICGTGNKGSEDGYGTSATIDYPMGVCVDKEKNIYFTDYSTHVLRKMARNLCVTTISGFSGEKNFADGSGTNSRLNCPIGICCNVNTGDLFIADYGNQRIRKWSNTYFSLSTIAGNGAIGSSVGYSSQFNGSYGVCCDTNGDVYVADCYNHRICKINSSNQMVEVAGICKVSGSIDGTFGNATFNVPVAVCFNEDRNLLVTDFEGHNIRLINFQTKTVSTVAGGVKGHADGPAKSAKFSNPVGICTEGSNIYVADYGNHRIRKIAKDGTVVTIAGKSEPGFQDGPLNTSLFNSPVGITNYEPGVLIVSDASNHCLRKLYLPKAIDGAQGWQDHLRPIVNDDNIDSAMIVGKDGLFWTGTLDLKPTTKPELIKMIELFFSKNMSSIEKKLKSREVVSGVFRGLQYRIVKASSNQLIADYNGGYLYICPAQYHGGCYLFVMSGPSYGSTSLPPPVEKLQNYLNVASTGK